MALNNIRKTLQTLGFINGGLYLLSRSLQKISRGKAFVARYHFVAQPVPQHSTSRIRPSAKFHIRQVDLDDPIVTAFPRPSHVIKQRFDDGAICFAAENDGEFAGYLWLTRHAYEEDEVRCRYEFGPPELCAWDYDVYVEPKYRIGRTFARLWEAANSHLGKAGVHWSLSRISAFNMASIAAHQRLEMKKIGTATFIVLGPVQFSMLPAFPYFHISSTPSKRPLIQLIAPSLLKQE